MGHSVSNHKKKKKINPLSPNCLIFGTSVAWHVCMKLTKPFEFRMVLEICPTEFSLFWGFHDINRPLAIPIATSFYVCNYLHWLSVGMKIGKSIVFEVENQVMKVKTLKNIRFWFKCGSYQSKTKSKKCLNWTMVVKLLQKKSKYNFDKTLQ